MGAAAGTLHGGGQGGSPQEGTQPNRSSRSATLTKTQQNTPKQSSGCSRRSTARCQGLQPTGTPPEVTPPAPEAGQKRSSPFLRVLGCPPSPACPPSSGGSWHCPPHQGVPRSDPHHQLGLREEPPPAWQCHGAAAPQHPLGCLKAVIKPSPRQIPRFLHKSSPAMGPAPGQPDALTAPSILGEPWGGGLVVSIPNTPPAGGSSAAIPTTRDVPKGGQLTSCCSSSSLRPRDLSTRVLVPGMLPEEPKRGSQRKDPTTCCGAGSHSSHSENPAQEQQHQQHPQRAQAITPQTIFTNTLLPH